jgi:hypothetical protein
MKALVLVLVLLCLATFAFAFDIGLGASGTYYMSSLKADMLGIPTETLITGIPINFMAFADAGYLQVSAGYRILNNYHLKGFANGVLVSEGDATFSLNYVSFAAYGKLPIGLGSITFFPMIGVEYDRAISGTSGGVTMTSQDLSDATEFWIKGGLGADIAVSPAFYVRPELIVGYKLLSKPENDLVTLTKTNPLITNVSLIDLSFELAVFLGVKL